MKKQISSQVEHPIRPGTKTPEDVLGPETTEPSAYSHSDEEPAKPDKKDRSE